MPAPCRPPGARDDAKRNLKNGHYGGQDDENTAYSHDVIEPGQVRARIVIADSGVFMIQVMVIDHAVTGIKQEMEKRMRVGPIGASAHVHRQHAESNERPEAGKREQPGELAKKP